MTFKDIYNYNIEDLLKIDTTKFVYSAYVLYKDKDNIFIEYQVPIVKREFYNRYNNKELKIENSKIIKIDKIYKNYFSTNFTYKFDPYVIKKNYLSEFEDYLNDNIKIVEIYDIYNNGYPLRVKFANKSNNVAFTEIILNTENMYKSKIKNENLIYSFNKYSNYYDF